MASNTSVPLTREYAEEQDRKDPLAHLRDEFIIPSKADLKSSTLHRDGENTTSTPSDECIYLCGNSLGLQPKCTSTLINEHLSAWATKGVTGHFKSHTDHPLPGFLHVDAVVSEKMASRVGALKSEVAVMETLTANIHLLFGSFYKPTSQKHKIIMEGKAFPSDHYAVQSQITAHGFDPETSVVLIGPEDGTDNMSTAQICSVIDAHAESTALVWLPGIQYYTAEFLDMATITSHAHKKGILIGWDLAHAAGNVPLQLHDWDVDFAVWCNYKYLNSGPGSIAALFVHEKHGAVNEHTEKEWEFRPRLSGWWGGQKSSRFQMERRFRPMSGAQGYQVGNASTLACTSVYASLSVLDKHGVTPQMLRDKSLALTNYLEALLFSPSQHSSSTLPYRLITPRDPARRGAQLSVLLKEGLLDHVMDALSEAGCVVDERKPDVIRIAPAPLYNSYKDVWEFVRVFRNACGVDI